MLTLGSDFMMMRTCGLPLVVSTPDQAFPKQINIYLPYYISLCIYTQKTQLCKILGMGWFSVISKPTTSSRVKKNNFRFSPGWSHKELEMELLRVLLGQPTSIEQTHASGDQCELSQSSWPLIQAKKYWQEISAIFPLVSAISTQISAIVLHSLNGLLQVTSPVGHLWSSIRFARGKCPFNLGFLAQWTLVYLQGASLTRTWHNSNKFLNN